MAKTQTDFNKLDAAVLFVCISATWRQNEHLSNGMLTTTSIIFPRSKILEGKYY